MSTQLPDESRPSTVVLAADGSSFLVGDDAPMWPTSAGWVPDSSGFVQVVSTGVGGTGSTIQYVQRDGEVVTIDGLPPGVTALGLRAVDAEMPLVEESGLGPDAPIGAEVTLVGVDRGVAVHIDLRTGALTSWPTPDVGPDPDLFVADGAVIGTSALGADSLRTTLNAVRGQRIQGDSARPGPRYPGPDDDLMWRPDPDGPAVELVPIPFYGRSGSAANTVAVDLDAVLTTDGAGGLVYEQGGDVFVTDAATTRRLTSGELLAVGPSVAFARECGEDGTCRNVRLGADGSSVPLEGPAGAAIPPDSWSVTSGSASLDGDTMFVRLDPTTTQDDSPFSGSEWAFVDVDAALTLPAPEPDAGRPIHWSDDGRFAFYLVDRLVHVVDLERQSIVALQTAGEFDAITTVPLDFAG